jgi:hypothetical protein
MMVEAGLPKIPFLKKKYTPLLFFKTPPGILPESDAMEKVISEVEKELGVRVERVDVLRDPPSQALLTLVTNQEPPLLYHRESCQRVSVRRPKASADENKSPVVTIDKEQVRAWAKGRFVSAKKEPLVDSATARGPSPVVVSQKGDEIDTVDPELLDEMNLSPLQRKGKEAIKERTEEKSMNKKE